MVRWTIYLGRINIIREVVLLKFHLTQPRSKKRPFGSGINAFAYLNKQPHPPIVLDDEVIKMNKYAFKQTDSDESICRDIQEELPSIVPEPLGNPVLMTCFIDATTLKSVGRGGRIQDSSFT